MRIAYIYDVIYPYVKGGVEKRIWELGTRLTQRGHEVHLFGMKYWDGPDILLKDGVHLHGVCQPQELYTHGRRSITEAAFFAWKLLPDIVRDKFDVIDCQNSPYFPSFSGKLHSVLKKSRLVITWHEVWGDYWSEYLGKLGIFGKGIERIVAHLADRDIAVSEITKDGLRMIGVKKEIEVIPNGIDFGKIAQIKKAEIESDVIFAGRFIREKNVDILIKAINLVKKEAPDIKCVLIGDGPERHRLEKLAYDMKAGASVSFMGFLEDHDDVIAHMKASKVFVLPSTREGFGIVVLEANACGLPVITVNHERNASKDLISEGDNGFLCQLSEKDVAQKIQVALVNNQSLEERCSASARKFDWDRIVNLTEAVYKKVIRK